jgi:DNA repair protein RecN (Recombination protein N)
MLRRLEIDSYGLIGRAEVEFAPGATIFTGETGSGKTMLLGALGFGLGARAGPDVVRRGARKTTVTLAFEPSDELRERLSQDGFTLDRGEEATIEREMSEAGRSSVRVNGRPSTAAYLREIGAAIVEITGQHEAQRLLSPSYHLALLDRFAGDEALTVRAAVVAAHTRADELTQALEQLTRSERDAQARHDEACFALEEIEGARLQAGEEERLNERRRYLENVERIESSLRRAREALADEEAGAAAALGEAEVALSAIAPIGGELGAMAQAASVLQSEANDLAAAVARALEAAEFDPAELESINARLDQLDRLKRKYGGSVEQVMGYAAQAREAIDAYEGRDRRVAELRALLAVAEKELSAAAATLSSLRRSASVTLAKRIVAEFGEIALGSGRFEVAFEPIERIGPLGAERAEFLFAANAGEPARPLSRVAAGGELSRVLLALVVALAGAREIAGTLVFDEVDAGIGGATATAVGARIGALARVAQILCVTHLAQLATWADRHYVLDKSEEKGQTTISVREISSPKQREAEIARLLSGESHDAALRHARTLLARDAEARSG